MPEFNVRSDSVNVEQIMEQIRARIREKRGVDYTEQQIRELATVKLEQFLDARGVRSALLDEFRRVRAEQAPAEPLTYTFEADTLYASHRVLLRWIRRLLQPVLKLFFNPNTLIQALHIQSKLNSMYTERRGLDQLYFEVLHNLVLETTRLGIEVKNLTMRVESLASRLEFNERRARALERVVVYKPDVEEDAETPLRPDVPGAARERDSPSDRTAHGSPSEPGQTGQMVEGPGQRSQRRRRRRGRRGGGTAVAVMAGPVHNGEAAASEAREPTPPEAGDSTGGLVDPESDHREARPQPSSRGFGAEAPSTEPAPGEPSSSHRSDPDQQ